MAPHVKTACVLHSPLPVIIALPRLLHHGQQPKRRGRRERCSAEALDLPTTLSTCAHAPTETASISEEAEAGNEERAAEILTGAEVNLAAAEGRCRGAWESGAPSRGSFTARLGCWLRSKHNRDLADLAVPALFSIALDPLMNLGDTLFQRQLISLPQHLEIQGTTRGQSLLLLLSDCAKPGAVFVEQPGICVPLLT